MRRDSKHPPGCSSLLYWTIHLNQSTDKNVTIIFILSKLELYISYQNTISVTCLRRRNTPRTINKDRVGGWWVACKILLSASVPIGIGIGIRGLGLGLDNKCFPNVAELWVGHISGCTCCLVTE